MLDCGVFGLGASGSKMATQPCGYFTDPAKECTCTPMQSAEADKNIWQTFQARSSTEPTCTLKGLLSSTKIWPGEMGMNSQAQ